MSEFFTAVAVIVVAYWFFRSPMCGALSESIRRRHGTVADGETVARMGEIAEQVVEEVSALREDVAELAERVEFTERALTAMRRDALPVERAGS